METRLKEYETVGPKLISSTSSENVASTSAIISLDYSKSNQVFKISTILELSKYEWFGDRKNKLKNRSFVMLWMYKNVYKIFKSEYILVQNYCSSKVNREVKHVTFLSNDGKRK